jgi:hypothetical protein
MKMILSQAARLVPRPRRWPTACVSTRASSWSRSWPNSTGSDPKARSHVSADDRGRAQVPPLRLWASLEKAGGLSPWVPTRLLPGPNGSPTCCARPSGRQLSWSAASGSRPPRERPSRRRPGRKPCSSETTASWRCRRAGTGSARSVPPRPSD